GSFPEGEGAFDGGEVAARLFGGRGWIACEGGHGLDAGEVGEGEPGGTGIGGVIEVGQGAVGSELGEEAGGVLEGGEGGCGVVEEFVAKAAGIGESVAAVMFADDGEVLRCRRGEGGRSK